MTMVNLSHRAGDAGSGKEPLNIKEIAVRGGVVTVSRRFLPADANGLRKVRVRVVARKGLGLKSSPVLFNEYRDYADMHEADATYVRHIRHFQNA